VTGRFPSVRREVIEVTCRRERVSGPVARRERGDHASEHG
jgi:hypothetical protein